MLPSSSDFLVYSCVVSACFPAFCRTRLTPAWKNLPWSRSFLLKCRHHGVISHVALCAIPRETHTITLPQATTKTSGTSSYTLPSVFSVEPVKNIENVPVKQKAPVTIPKNPLKVHVKKIFCPLNFSWTSSSKTIIFTREKSKLYARYTEKVPVKIIILNPYNKRLLLLIFLLPKQIYPWKNDPTRGFLF